MSLWVNDSELFREQYTDNYYVFDGYVSTTPATTTPSLGLESSIFYGNNKTSEYTDHSGVIGDVGGVTTEVGTVLASTLDSTVIPDFEFWIFDEKYLRHSIGWTVAFVVAYVLILLIGIVGNCMVILVVLLRPQMRTVTNMFIMNLAVADLAVIIFCVPATLLATVLIPWVLGSFMCKGVTYVQGVSVFASAYSLAAISLDRCKAIYRPMERPRGLSKSQALFTICLIWILAMLITLPYAIVFDVTRPEIDGLPFCQETGWKTQQHGKVYFLVAHLICCYSLPLVLISLSNIVIWCHVAKRKVPQDTASASVGTIKRMHRRTRHGVRKMLGIVTLTFLICWLPLYCVATRIKFSEHMGETENNWIGILMPLAQWLAQWNSSINPVLYAFLNSKFRESFKSLMPSWISLHCLGNSRSNTITNGTRGPSATATPSYATVYTARSSGRSNNSSRHFKSHNNRTLLVSNMRTTMVANHTTASTITDL